ncbi:MAG: helix-turn-helix domain-containing protein [Limosilactobacillus coleohominis]|nr:helix-turn-helix domain-containing protein [Limosilactobacillus coleohominis]MDY3702639.1 helix-turn-helix domain-containing protein [Limosilactobacillus coleohominis]
MDQTKKFNTGAEYALSVLSGKWKAVIVFLLAGHPWRTGELRKQLGISQKVLSEQLQDLIAAGIVERRSLPVIPPHVEYSLTSEGEDLYAALRYLNYWGEQRAQADPNVEIQCTEKMHELGLDGLCVVTKRHLNHWKQELVHKK